MKVLRSLHKAFVISAIFSVAFAACFSKYYWGFFIARPNIDVISSSLEGPVRLASFVKDNNQGITEYPMSSTPQCTKEACSCLSSLFAEICMNDATYLCNELCFVNGLSDYSVEQSESSKDLVLGLLDGTKWRSAILVRDKNNRSLLVSTSQPFVPGDDDRYELRIEDVGGGDRVVLAAYNYDIAGVEGLQILRLSLISFGIVFLFCLLIILVARLSADIRGRMSTRL